MAKEVKQNISDTWFVIALFLIACLILPFLYYATEVYAYAHANKPEGFLRKSIFCSSLVLD